MANISKTNSLSAQYKTGGKLMMLLLILLTICIFSRPSQADTSIYVFGSDQSTVVKTGGFAGVNITYAVTGQFQLTVDSDAGVASFETVDANLTDEAGLLYGQSLDEIFNMTGLAGTVVDDRTIEFEGKTADGTESNVSLSLKLSIKDDSAHLTGKTTPPPDSADMFFYDIDAVATKKYAGGTGEPNDPYQIATAEDLILLGDSSDDYDKHFILTADIDLDPNLPGRKVFDRAVIAPATWELGSYSWLLKGSLFTGLLDGAGHEISQLTIQGKEYLGLFGVLESGASVKSLAIKDVRIAGSGSNIGALSGSNAGEVTDCHSTGIVSGGDCVGGLVGSNGTMHALRIAAVYAPGIMTQCYSTATVSGNASVGGLAGSNPSDTGHIMYCYSAGAVSGDSEVGGLVGTNGGHVIQCHSAGTVGGTRGVGGLVGSNLIDSRDSYEGHVIQCYSTGRVTGTDLIGGLMGYGEGASACFWDMQTSGQSTSAGGTGKTTAEMQTATTFLDAGWDFVDETDNGTEEIWSICEGTNYPRFVWQIAAGDFVCPDGITIDDFSFFMEHWLDDNCDLSNDFCQGTDLDQSGTVDAYDLEIFFENWSAEN